MSTHEELPALNSTEAGLSERQSNRVPGYKVFEVTKDLPEAQQLAVRWLHGHYYDNALSLGEVGKLISYDPGTVSKVFHGKYEGDLASVAKAIERYRRLSEERAAHKKAPYIKTSLYREIEQCCQAALNYQKIVFIYGESQVGKTAALKKYAEDHNHGETIYVEMPPGGSLTNFLAVLAGKMRFTAENRSDNTMMKIYKGLGPNNLVIVDEASRALQARTYGGSALKTMDFLRAVHDNTGCGMVLCGTNVFREQMEDRSLGKFLNQFNRRCLLRRQLPDLPSRADLNAFARHYELDAASGEALDLQKRIVRDHGLGVWLTTMTAAARKATKEGKAMTWDHVLNAHAFLRKLEQTTNEEGA
jgi:DNA transposition AAA+ family ATPase